MVPASVVSRGSEGLEVLKSLNPISQVHAFTPPRYQAHGPGPAIVSCSVDHGVSKLDGSSSWLKDMRMRSGCTMLADVET